MFLFSCSDEEQFTVDSNALISFSKDTIAFDTVFSTIGSSTKNFQVYNRNDKGVKLTDIRLASGGKNGFRINVDGQYGTQFSNINILKEDSIFIFVEITANPQDEDSPILVKDSIMFTQENGKRHKVILEAFGQDVIIMKDVVLDKDTTLSSAKPYVIYDSLVVKENVTLTLAPGTTLCFHSGAELDVHGTLEAIGTLDKPITMRGDRTDKMFWYLPYDRLDGQWEGVVFFSESVDNELSYVDMHGANFGIECVYSGEDEQKLSIRNSSIHNMQNYCLTSVCNKINVSNSQFSNAGTVCVQLFGGTYQFTHTTIAQFYPWSSDSGCALWFTNVDEDYAYPLNKLTFNNSIITGQSEDEIMGTRYVNENGEESDNIAFNVQFNNCLVRTDTTGASNLFVDCAIEHKDSITCGATNFRNIDNDNFIYNFRLDTLSRARNIGNPTYSKNYKKDKNGVIRKTDHPDAGCYEFVE